MMSPAPFIFVVDKHGMSIDIFPGDSTFEYIHDFVRIFNKNYPDSAPHVPWFFNGEMIVPLSSPAFSKSLRENLH